MKKVIYLMAAVMLVAGNMSCSKSKGWEVSGTVADAAGSRLALESYNNGAWYVVDSLTVSADGRFDYRSPQAAPYPEIMRLTMDGRSIYFPVDSIDNVSIETTAKAFGTSYKITGSDDADRIRRIDSIITASVATRGAALTRTDSELKKQLLTLSLEAPTVMASYYLINKAVDGKPLFDLRNRNDIRYFGAVAQRFRTERPADPRAAYLERVYIEAQKQSRPAQTTTIEVPETGLFDIVRQDNKGVSHSLAELASKGGVVILSFIAYGAEPSAAYNLTLNSVYEKYKDAGLEIYQISFDDNETVWRQSAANLPWITVWNSTTDDSAPLINYNVGAVPMTFVIDRTGTVAARVTDPAKIEQEVARVI